MKMGDFKLNIQGPSGTYLLTSEQIAEHYVVNLTYRETEILLNDYITEHLREVLDFASALIAASEFGNVPVYATRCPECGTLEIEPSPTSNKCRTCNKVVNLRRIIL